MDLHVDLLRQLKQHCLRSIKASFEYVNNFPILVLHFISSQRQRIIVCVSSLSERQMEIEWILTIPTKFAAVDKEFMVAAAYQVHNALLLIHVSKSVFIV